MKEPWWFDVKRVLDARDEAQKTVEAAFRCDYAGNAVYYRDGLTDLVRAEAMVDCLCMTLEVSRNKLYEWVDTKYKEIKKIEAEMKRRLKIDVAKD